MYLVVSPAAFAEGLFGALGSPQNQNSTFSRDASNAYVEALEFSLWQVGSPKKFDKRTKTQIYNKLRQEFSSLSFEAQLKLSQSRKIWAYYRDSWPMLSMADKKEFIFDVLALAYGEAAANEALGINTAAQSQQSSGNANSYTSGDGVYVSDGKCSIISTSSGSITKGNC